MHTKILITGGLGYIGSHTILKLKHTDNFIICVDDMSVNYDMALRRREYLKQFNNIVFENVDITREYDMNTLMDKYRPDYCIHFAALKSVPDSFKNRAEYERINIGGTTIIENLCKIYGVKNLVFSSSCAVYGEPLYYPVDELHRLNPISPYAETKKTCEDICKDWTILRYFNPLGTNCVELRDTTSGGIAEALTKNNMVIFGKDYDTVDGTPVRDYIHIDDLANAHITALNLRGIYNVGTGTGYSALQIAEVYKKHNPNFVYTFGERRIGDIGCIYADTTKIEPYFKCQKTLDDIILSLNVL